MKSKLLLDEGEKVYVVVLETGEEVVSLLMEFALEKQLTASQITGIGALREVTLGHFNLEKRDYKRIPLKEQVEVLSLVGNIATDKNQPRIHAHIVVGRSDGSAFGGHLIEAYVRPTLEVIIQETPEHLWRKTDPATGLALIDLDR
ncbi:PPC domain-containing DNA-binding protein [Pedosphaera parvula]|uniref:PPC domain-containing protein n=1 Tax=Pedosphaera parvula (strain Ellin514) TaxID=320771 RepID=B9XB61_PEDPL|nr:PPC domain-containing DNA-binding protein [Pedosphaera parvula]EEF62746.1 protein of unknown function DUF296 [Pedosphaera parvula Ellin514]